jgi:DNA repair protein RadD
VQLRPYQAEAIDATWKALSERQGNPCIVLPTGSGKTCLLATMCQQAVEWWGGSLMVVSHVKELLEQLEQTIAKWAPALDVELNKRGLHSAFLCGDTPDVMRSGLIANFKSGQLRCLVNCNVLTTGFDATNIDCVVILRATCSPGLFYQMCGRGFRLHPGKEDCLVLDYGENIQRHGPLDAPDYGEASCRNSEGGGTAPKKICPACEEDLPLAARECDCGFIFHGVDEPKPKHGTQADKDTHILGAAEPPEWIDVDLVQWRVWEKKGHESGDPHTLRVDYYKDVDAVYPYVSEFICFEHDGWLLQKAENWWLCRSKAPIPRSIEQALEWYERGAIADTTRILVGPDKKNPRYKRVTEHELGIVPDPAEWIDPSLIVEIPF